MSPENSAPRRSGVGNQVLQKVGHAGAPESLFTSLRVGLADRL